VCVSWKVHVNTKYTQSWYSLSQSIVWAKYTHAKCSQFIPSHRLSPFHGGYPRGCHHPSPPPARGRLPWCTISPSHIEYYYYDFTMLCELYCLDHIHWWMTTLFWLRFTYIMEWGRTNVIHAFLSLSNRSFHLLLHLIIPNTPCGKPNTQKFIFTSILDIV